MNLLPRLNRHNYNDNVIERCEICGIQLWGHINFYKDISLCEYHYNHKLRKEKLEKINKACQKYS
jgi:hypothetical protein